VWTRYGEPKGPAIFILPDSTRISSFATTEPGRWQQINWQRHLWSLKGAALELGREPDELTSGLKSEVSDGKVLGAPVTKYPKKYDSNWDQNSAKMPVVISFRN